MSHKARTRRINANGSLRDFPLVGHVLTQKVIRTEERAVDAQWLYVGAIPVSVTGFNPTCGRIFYARYSFLARWLQDEHQVPRSPEAIAWLLYELFFLVHDYLHHWAYNQLGSLVRDALHQAERDAGNAVERLSSIHLVSEAVATVGLDYWYLSRVDASRVLGVRTSFRNLAADYRACDEALYRRLNPGFSALSPKFLGWMVSGYLTGRFVGFSAAEVRRFTRLRRWLQHEVVYGAKQRVLARQWWSYLLGYEAESKRDLARRVPVVVTRRELARLADLLWGLVHQPHDHSRTRGDGRAALRLTNSRVDYRYTNVFATPLNREQLGHELQRCSDSAFPFLASQLISAHHYPSGRHRDVSRLKSFLVARNAVGVVSVLNTLEPIEQPALATRDLFLPN